MPNFSKKLLILFAGVFFLSSCATTSAPPVVYSTPSRKTLSVYQTLPLTKSLLSSPNFKVIDDFNSGERKNLLGGRWIREAEHAGKINYDIDKDDGRGHYRGLSMKINYRLEPNEYASIKSDLNRLDISQAQYLALKCRHKTDSGSFTGRMRISLTDWRGRSVLHDFTEQCSDLQHTWSDVIIPISIFNTLDLNQLHSLAIILKAKNSMLVGDMWIDELAFYGDNNVEFESHRDNLKGFPKTVIQAKRQAQLKRMAKIAKRGLLREIARDTWKYFEQASDKKTHLIVDHIRLGDAPLAANYTSPTNISMDLLAAVAAFDLKFIRRQQAIDHIQSIFETMRRLKRWNGFFYNFYETTRLSVTRDYVSTVDSGWLAISLVVVRQAFPQELGEQASRFLDEFDFSRFLDPDNNQLSVGYDGVRGSILSYHYGLLASEARATSFYAIGKGDIGREHWWFLFRTPPEAWRWQTQQPQGTESMQDGVTYFQGYYQYQGKKFVPSWGGSLFEFLMPTLVMRETQLAPKGLGLNNRVATEIHRDYALKEKKYPVWGISPASMANGRQWKYSEFGIKTLGAKGYPERGVVTPHVSFLALDSLPDDAVENIIRFLDFNMYGEYGFYDSLNLVNQKVNYQYLALDQGMTLVAICNYLQKGSIQKRFHQDSVGKKAEDLLVKESFFKT
ncbi:MAG: DUF3131 domain-containing protein [Candidatus Omnitrophica bacterium]|nr:DUF3131 domain-containing protein [Candidatus Omnitrophota bacterium]